MQVNELTAAKLRELAGARGDGARVLSVYLNLDPSQFPTTAARATEARSVVDEANRRLRDAHDELTHEQRQALHNDVERVGELLVGDLPAKGAHALAVFASEPLGLFETLRLPRAVDTRVVIDDVPHIEPLTELASAGDWCVLLVNRQVGRMLRGDAEHFEELAEVVDETHGQHRQGGWSQPRYERSIEKDVDDHLKRFADVAFRRFKRSPFQHILVGGPEEIAAAFQDRLHSYLSSRLAGRINVDVENSTPDDIRQAALATVERVDEKRERETLDRLREGVAREARAAAGLGPVLEALNERRVEALLVADGFAAPGRSCPTCGWLGPDGTDACPADGTELERRDDVAEAAVAAALLQSAEVVHVRRNPQELGSHGSIGALLRF